MALIVHVLNRGLRKAHGEVETAGDLVVAVIDLEVVVEEVTEEETLIVMARKMNH